MGTVILGAGIAGLSAGYHLRQKGVPSVIYEKDADWGGLCGSFEMDGFRFDRFVHVSFPDNENDRKLFAGRVGLYEHVPMPSNIWRGHWLPHPAISNLAPLADADKVKIIASFVTRPRKAPAEIKRYDEWLRVQYGDCYAENFPFVYTRKYWGVEAAELETRWAGVRMRSPALEEVLQGSYHLQDECLYHVKKQYYPKAGGYKGLMAACREGLDIRLNKRVVKILPRERQVVFTDGEAAPYGRLISTLPLPEVVKMMDEVPPAVATSAGELRHTHGYHVSLGFNRPDVAKYLWFYIYDDGVLASRVYSPSLMSPDNAPAGCSSLQAEVFFDNRTPALPTDFVLENTLTSLIKMGLFEERDIAVKGIRYEPYANVTFVPSIYENRKTVRGWLASQGVETIGRFGRWDYLWSHQAFATGRDV